MAQPVTARMKIVLRAMGAIAVALFAGEASAQGRHQPTGAAQPAAPPPQGIPCLPVSQPLVNIPEFVSVNGVLRGTILLSDEQQRIGFRLPPGFGNVPGAPGTYTVCQPQYMRYFRGIDAKPELPPPAQPYPDPVPGPTLRARVGDVIELTFLNQINPNNFGNSIDRAESGDLTGPAGGCDETSGIYPVLYPPNNPPVQFDKFPDCFHGSSTGNIHFHGTHTDPNAAGDNVFIEVRPSPRDGQGRPIVTEDKVKPYFDQFFAECETQLKRDVLLQWPETWNDPPLGPPSDPRTWTAEQKRLLQEYDRGRPPPQQLWPTDERQYAKGDWPQYYIGAFPYCFRLPDYTASSFPPPDPSAAGHEAMPTMGLLSPPRVLQMGQAPGTHWYHAHKHGSTTINVANGMTGAFIIEGKYDDGLNAYYGQGWTRKQPVLVVNQIGVSPNLERYNVNGVGVTDKGADFLVNGRSQPVLKMWPGQVQLWRIVNTSSRSGIFFAKLPAGFHWKQLAQDGVQFADVNYQNSKDPSFLTMAGNRVDLLVKAPLQASSALANVMVQPAVSNGDLQENPPAVVLLSVDVSGSGPEMQFLPNAPAFPPFLADIADSEIKGTRTLVFNSLTPQSPVQHTIDGKQFDGNVGAVVLLNQAEEWTIENTTTFAQIDHPFHIHINPFQVVEVFDPNETIGDVNKYVFSGGQKASQCVLDVNKPNTWKPCERQDATNAIWWDTFAIPSGRAVKVKQPDGTEKTVVIPGYMKIRSRFVDYAGYYVLHCHILAHEDRGMMTVVEVAPLQSPYAHQ